MWKWYFQTFISLVTKNAYNFYSTSLQQLFFFFCLEDHFFKSSPTLSTVFWMIIFIWNANVNFKRHGWRRISHGIRAAMVSMPLATTLGPSKAHMFSYLLRSIIFVCYACTLNALLTRRMYLTEELELFGQPNTRHDQFSDFHWLFLPVASVNFWDFPR